MSLKEFLESDYISAQEVVDGDKVVIITPPVMKEGSYEGRATKKLEARVEYKGKQRILGWNRTNAKVCAESWGDQEQGWVGKVAVLKTVNKTIRGQLKKVLVIEPEKPATPKVEKPEWMKEEDIQAKIKELDNMIGRDAAIQILMKQKEKESQS